MLRFTERPNPLTRALSSTLSGESDDASGFLALLAATDGQVFDGLDDEPGSGLASPATIAQIHAAVGGIRDAASAAAQAGAAADVWIVMSGCGTSGRLAFHTARALAPRLQAAASKGNSSGDEPIFKLDYLIAGGDYALLKSQERGEDDPSAGVEDLLGWARSLEPGSVAAVVLVGITCGMSAPYVAGQLDFVRSVQRGEIDNPLGPHTAWAAGLIGFNPIHLARASPIEGYPRTFKDVAQELAESIAHSPENFVINPVVGPEPVTGSTRMKGGSATKILLEVLVSCVAYPSLDPAALIAAYAAVKDAVYAAAGPVADLVIAGGAALRSGAPIYYLAADFGLAHLGIIDASECPPTYGALPTDVRGFIPAGWAGLGNRAGDLSQAPKPGFDWDLSAAFAASVCIPSLAAAPGSGRATIVVSLGSAGWDAPLNDELAAAVTAVASLPSGSVTAFGLIVGAGANAADGQALVSLADAGFSLLRVDLAPALAAESAVSAALAEQYAAKLTFNALTTGAHVLKGKVAGNMMIDVAVSNSKLYTRALGIIAKYSGASAEQSEAALLRAIYDDAPPPDATSIAKSTHIKAAMKRTRVVPVAILLAAAVADSVPAAAAVLDAEPMVSSVIQQSAAAVS